MFYYKLPPAGNLHESVGCFLDDLCTWIRGSASSHDPHRSGRMRDQAVLPSAWLPVLRYSPQKAEIMQWVTCFRDSIRDHFTHSGQWSHGYWREGQGADGTAHFRIFLNALWRHCPQDTETVRQFLDAAEHLGNWVSTVPPWFDWEHGLFRALQPGTADLPRGAGPAVNIPGHLHYLTMALCAYEMGGGQRYLDLAVCQGRNWVRALVGGTELPLAVGPQGPIYQRMDFARMQSGANRAWVTSKRRSTPVARARELLSAGGVDVMLKLWQHVREPDFKLAAERILDVLIGQIEEVDAGDVVAAFRHYRNYTGDACYDAAILDCVASLYPYRVEVIGVSAVGPGDGDPRGFAAAPPLRWLENGQSRQHNPLLLGLAAEISGNERMAARALDLARGYFLLARRFLPDGFALGQAERSVCAICRGNSRENGAGMVTEVLLPLLSAFDIQP